MPEGDTVWLAARRMNDALAGRVLTRTDFRVPRLATTDLTGRAVIDVVSRGKHMLTRVDGGVTVHTHFEMDGSWHVYRTGARWKGGPGWQVRLVLENPHWQAVGYRLPVIDVVATDAEAGVVGHLGPDLLGADWDEPEAVRRLAAPQRKTGSALLDRRSRAGIDLSIPTPPMVSGVAAVRAIGEALLDQRCVAGIGNLYKSESLFLAGVSPWSPVHEVDVAKVLRIARRLMIANREHPEQSTTGDLRRGEQHWVYRRAGRPCRRCDGPITSAMQGEPPYDRVAFWCRSCQPQNDLTG